MAMNQEPYLENASSVIKLVEMAGLYNQHSYLQTPASRIFWSVPNLRHVVNQLESVLSKFSGKAVQVVTDDVFFLEAAKMVNEAGNSPDVQRTVAVLNENFVNKMVPLHMQTMKRRKLFFKYYIYKDRARIVDYPMDTHGRRRINRPSNFTYTLNNPDKKQWCDFRQAVERQKYSAQKPSLFDVYF
jgi:hypothetical protein